MVVGSPFVGCAQVCAMLLFMVVSRVLVAVCVQRAAFVHHCGASTPAALVRFVNRPLPSLMKSAFGPPQEVTNKSRSPSPSTSPNAAPVLDIPGAPTPASVVMFLNCQAPRFLNSPLSPSRLHR